MDVNSRNIVLFDGVCNLCNYSVQFVLKRDKKEKFKFASLQSEVGQALLNELGLPKNDLNSFVYIKGDKCYVKSAASLNVIKQLNTFWKVLYIFIIIPRPIRDFCYDIIAKNRYKLFGKQESCMIPAPELAKRFL